MKERLNQDQDRNPLNPFWIKSSAKCCKYANFLWNFLYKDSIKTKMISSSPLDQEQRSKTSPSHYRTISRPAPALPSPQVYVLIGNAPKFYRKRSASTRILHLSWVYKWGINDNNVIKDIEMSIDHSLAKMNYLLLSDKACVFCSDCWRRSEILFKHQFILQLCGGFLAFIITLKIILHFLSIYHILLFPATRNRRLCC